MTRAKRDPEDLQSEIEKKAARRAKRKKPNMKVSGRSVKQLQRIIISKGKKKETR